MSQPVAPSDPWRSFRGVMAGVLLLEAIVVLLAIPVVGVTGRGLTAVTGTYLIGVAVLMVVLSALQRRPWAIWANLAVQVIVIGGFFVAPAGGFVGLLFTGGWVLIVYLRAGLLRGQHPPPDGVG